jgi:tRNA wybutosine-synthesizing protein 4
LEGVAGTADTAARGKLAAVRAGYYSDAFAPHFVSGSCPSPGPLINRGHFIRVMALESVLRQFLEASKPARAQIISLGAGFDTRFWTLQASGTRLRRFIELDQAEVVARKAAVVRASPSLLAALPEGAACVGPRGIASPSTGYHLSTADVRDTAQCSRALEDAGWDPTEPTLVLAECVLVYLPPSDSAALLAWFASRSTHVALVAYEQIGPDDSFGRMMLDNLRRRGCPLLGLLGCPDLAAQVARCEAAGWDRTEADDLLTLYNRSLSPAERARVEGLERLDEMEEWNLMLSHYCAVLAVKGPLLARLQLHAIIGG